MWQRVQTLYLAVALMLVAALFWSDVARVAGPDGIVENIRFTDKTIYLVWLTVLSVLQLLSLGGFKWRMRQFRMVVISAVMCLGFQGYLAYDFFSQRDNLSFSWTVLLPAVAFVLDVMAAKNILVDEALVQSANRLRLPRNRDKR